MAIPDLIKERRLPSRCVPGGCEAVAPWHAACQMADFYEKSRKKIMTTSEAIRTERPTTNSKLFAHTKRMAPEWLGGYELRRLDALQSRQRLAAFQLKFDPAFHCLTQCLRSFVARFASSPSTRKIAQLGIIFVPLSMFSYLAVLERRRCNRPEA